ncbi:MAG: hypothetical protein EOO11_08480 [Chitinophagaceae bacterium]|nr:MAG: hypothetical protein EOO11_08480 [Chitinophagaceae bacterium]
MKIILLSATEAAMPSMDWLLRNGCLLTLLCPGGDEHPGTPLLEAWADAQGLPCWQVSSASVERELTELVRETAPDLVLLYGFPYRIAPALFDACACPAWNMHFGLEPLDEAGRMKGTITLHEWKGAGEKVLQQHRILLGRSEADPIARLSDLSVSLLAQALQGVGLKRITGPAGSGVAAVF